MICFSLVLVNMEMTKCPLGYNNASCNSDSIIEVCRASLATRQPSKIEMKFQIFSKDYYVVSNIGVYLISVYYRTLTCFIR